MTLYFFLYFREHKMGDEADLNLIKNYKNMLKYYDEQKNIMEKAFDCNEVNSKNSITPLDIKKTMENLFTLKHNGEKIKEMYKMQQRCEKQEHRDVSEYNFTNKNILCSLNTSSSKQKDKGL